MSMKYDEALKLWGYKKLQEKYGNTIKFLLDTVKVEMDFDAGYTCCGGSDPDCYCSLAESPSASVKISAKVDAARFDQYWVSVEISHYSFDFVTVLKEIVEVGEGEISL